MKKSDFDFELPEELIAQTPIQQRDHSRLMHLDKQTGEISHEHFYDLPRFLKKGDCLVLNDSRVLPARLIGCRSTGGSVELVLLRDLGEGRWECLSRPGRKTKPGTELNFGGGELTATVESVAEGGNRIVKFHYEGIFLEILERLGKMPLPPYIKEALRDKSRYQTVYAREEGSAAAPTAGLHFTTELLDKIKAMGVEIAPVMLHIGLGTFRPVKVESITDHHMHTEFFSITEESAEKINRARANGGRIVAVGTTSCRVLESASDKDGIVHATEDDTGIFIYPGYKFKAVDALITNFHLPESTLLMLVSALAGKDFIMRAYKEAVDKGYKFFSFGDAMLIE